LTVEAIWLRMHTAPMVVGAWISAGQNPPLLPDIAIVGQDRVNAIRHSFQQVFQELLRCPPVSLVDQLGARELGG
jgi:hypothetical protein